ncbi:MAG: hypothetical protein GX447_00535 [Elusimicrobia bacterium]|nr:hypothetical protein [Elusimicrobiota bacterium]
MAFWSLFSKIPWGFIISKGPEIAQAVKNFGKKKELEIPEPDPNFTVLEKLVVEQAKLIASLSDETNEMKAKIDNMTKDILFLSKLVLALLIGFIFCFAALIAVYFKIS